VPNAAADLRLEGPHGLHESTRFRAARRPAPKTKPPNEAVEGRSPSPVADAEGASPSPSADVTAQRLFRKQNTRHGASVHHGLRRQMEKQTWCETQIAVMCGHQCAAPPIRYASAHRTGRSA
jgi:hypothetical protein